LTNYKNTLFQNGACPKKAELLSEAMLKITKENTDFAQNDVNQYVDENIKNSGNTDVSLEFK
jgi:hypothetical protein